MAGKWFLVGMVLVMAAVLATGCGSGITKQDYDVAVAERDSARAQLQSAQTELTTVKSRLDTVKTELSTVKSELQSRQSDRSNVASSVSNLNKKVALAEEMLNVRSLWDRAYEANRAGKTDDAKQFNAQAYTTFKSFDALVSAIGDSELSRNWGETWVENARQASERAQNVLLSFAGFAKFEQRLSDLMKSDMGNLQRALSK